MTTSMTAEDEEVINNWLDVARAPQNLPTEYAQFIALWEAFNRWLRVCFPPQAGVKELGDHDLVRKPSSEEHYKGIFQKLLSSNGYCDKLRALETIGDIDSVYAGDRRGKKPPRRIKKPYELENTLEVLYTIRCNLFHGGKSGDNTRDLGIVRSAYAVLEPFFTEAWADTLKTSKPQSQATPP